VSQFAAVSGVIVSSLTCSICRASMPLKRSLAYLAHPPDDVKRRALLAWLRRTRSAHADTLRSPASSAARSNASRSFAGSRMSSRAFSSPILGYVVHPPPAGKRRNLWRSASLPASFPSSLVAYPLRDWRLRGRLLRCPRRCNSTRASFYLLTFAAGRASVRAEAHAGARRVANVSAVATARIEPVYWLRRL